MKRTIVGTAVLIVICAWVAVPGQAQMSQPMGKDMMMMTKPAMDLGMAMRKLWEDHVTYTRNFIISSLAGLEDAGAVAERLLRNQDDIGNAIKPLYGEARAVEGYTQSRTRPRTL